MSIKSELNPEAPEFYPSTTSLDEVGYTKVSKVVRSSHVLPFGTSFNIFKTFTDFNVVSSNLCKNVIEQSNQILSSGFNGPRLKGNNNDYNIEKIIDINDDTLERVNINIDTTVRVNNPSQKGTQAVQLPIISQIKEGSTILLAAKDIKRPQIFFKDTIDNSENLWIPKIFDKPNSITPLALNILYDDYGRATGYEHPYLTELTLYNPSPGFFEQDPEPPVFPLSLEETKLYYIDTEEQLDELIEHLYSVNELSIDLEHHSYRTYQGITCVMQISTTDGGDFIIDTLAIREHIHKLNVIFTDPKKLKVFHGADKDVLWLQRDFGVYLVGMFDTYRAAKALNLPKLSLKFLLQRYCQIDVDKRYRLADWRMRPLPDVLISYARTDTHYLLYVWHVMKSELLKVGGEQLLLEVFKRSLQVCGYTYNKEVIHESSHIPLYLRSKKKFSVQQMAALKMLYKWRDINARREDESSQYLFTNRILLKLAQDLPREVHKIFACCNIVPPFIKSNVLTIHKMILSCLELPNQPYVHISSPDDSLEMNPERKLTSSCNTYDKKDYLSEGENHAIPDDNINLLESHESPDLPPFKNNNEINCMVMVSNLNAEAEVFIPPYDRYRKYRSLIQMKEIQDIKEREAKVLKLGSENELIRTEVIERLQNAQTQIANEDNVTPSTSNMVFGLPENTLQRKRKWSQNM